MEENKLKVCLMNDSFPPLIDGVAMTVLQYANILYEKGHSPFVAVPRLKDAKDDYPFPVLRYQSVDLRKLVGYTAGNPFRVPTLKKAVEMKPDVLHSHCPFASTFLARNIRQAYDAPLIFTYHSKFNVDIEKFFKSEKLQKMIYDLIVDNISACDEIWTVSEGAGENLKSLGYQGDYTVMPNGVDMPKGRPENEEVERVREEYRIRKDVPAFLFVGRLMWYKGLKLILDSLAAIKAEGGRFRMIFAGGGNETEEVKEYANKIGLTGEECTFAGEVRDRRKLRALYACADLFLFPSSYDTNGLVVREAAACAVPSVLLKGSCAAEGVKDGHTGFIIENNVASMTAVLRECIAFPGLMRKVGQNAMDKIYISWEDSVAAALQRYYVLVEEKESGRLQTKRQKTDKIFNISGNIVQVIEKIKEHQKRWEE